jgi:hypothetical protein
MTDTAIATTSPPPPPSPPPSPQPLPLPIATAAIITLIATATATAITTAKARQRDRRNMVTVPGASGVLCFFCVVWEGNMVSKCAWTVFVAGISTTPFLLFAKGFLSFAPVVPF